MKTNCKKNHTKQLLDWNPALFPVTDQLSPYTTQLVPITAQPATPATADNFASVFQEGNVCHTESYKFQIKEKMSGGKTKSSRM